MNPFSWSQMSPSSQKLNTQQSRVLTRTGYRHHAELSPERNMNVTRTRTCTGTRGWRCTQAAQVLATTLMTDVIGHARGHVRDTPGTALRHAPRAPTRHALADTRPEETPHKHFSLVQPILLDRRPRMCSIYVEKLPAHLGPDTSNHHCIAL